MANGITLRTALEIVAHEAIVCEAYRDSAGIWTWGIGITNASGHRVHPTYRDNPQPMRRCLEVFLEVLGRRYVPPVEAAFGGHRLSEAKFAAALSFHYNTGAIGRASWVRLWRDGRADEARAAILNWRRPAEILGRRKKEQALFFDGRWSHDGRATVYPVSKPSYSPRWAGATQVDIRAELAGLLG